MVIVLFKTAAVRRKFSLDDPDVIENLLCLCPNHHVLFDNGAFSIADDFSLIGQEGRLRISNAHRVDLAQAEYQRQMWGR
jgi:putative restriction endonuclease